MYAHARLAGAPAGYLELMSTSAAARVEALIDLRRYDDAVAEGRRALDKRDTRFPQVFGLVSAAAAAALSLQGGPDEQPLRTYT